MHKSEPTPHPAPQFHRRVLRRLLRIQEWLLKEAIVATLLAIIAAVLVDWALHPSHLEPAALTCEQSVFPLTRRQLSTEGRILQIRPPLDHAILRCIRLDQKEVQPFQVLLWL